jgi:hypothetical protein
MAKQNNGARGPANRSLILASAESLGRMIGALQRQLGVAKGSSGASEKTTGNGRTTKRPARMPKTTGKTKTKRRG